MHKVIKNHSYTIYNTFITDNQFPFSLGKSASLFAACIFLVLILQHDLIYEMLS